VADDLEHRLGIEERWKPEDVEYQRVMKYIKDRKFIRTIDELEGLVVQRLFELSKANLAGTGRSHMLYNFMLLTCSLGYKLRQHISKAIACQSASLCTTLDRYNKLAPQQDPPRLLLEYSDIISYSWLGDFNLLKCSWSDVMSKPWAMHANRDVAVKYFKVIHTWEEITRLNVEIHRLHKWVDDEDKHLTSTLLELHKTDKPLAVALSVYASACCHVNDIHQRQLKAVYSMKGFMGIQVDPADSVISEAELPSTTVLADEDDVLNDEMHRLVDCIQNMQ